jgi:hypothetical protein
MAQAALTVEKMREAIESVATYGNITNAALALNIPRETLQSRYNRAKLQPPEMLRAKIFDSTEWQARLARVVENGAVIVFSDAHYWPGAPSTAHRGLLRLIAELKPSLIVANGDVFDGARISRHPRIGWQQTPSVQRSGSIPVTGS